MPCPKCNSLMTCVWCDDDIHMPGMLYECKCGAKYWEEEGQEDISRLVNTSEKVADMSPIMNKCNEEFKKRQQKMKKKFCENCGNQLTPLSADVFLNCVPCYISLTDSFFKVGGR